MKRIIFLFLFLIISISQSRATHNRAGEITYTQIGPLTIRATITTYTKASSQDADRDSLTLFWGDGEATLVARSNQPGERVAGADLKINYYTAEHTYPGRATYTMYFTDPNRVNNIQNVNFPNSVEVPFYVETTFTFLNPQFQGLNNSVQLLQAPIDFACVGRRFVHNPNAYDVDGDSLSYELVVPFQSRGEEVPNYEFPDQILGGPNNLISLDRETGDFVWQSPQSAGEFNIAIKISEYRNGVLLNSVIRDMQIFVDICDNQPPSIEAPEEICVIAGERIQIDITVDDPDEGQLVKLDATGGPLLLDFSSAVLTNKGIYDTVARTETFIWETKCEHISETYYQVVFRAQDNSISENSGIAVLKTLRIKVVGPPPEEPTAEVTNNNSAIIRWQLPYTCEETINDYFIGFSVWRKIRSNSFELEECETGLRGRGYEPIVFLTTQNDGDTYYIEDDEIEKGKIYCYRILANFAALTSTGNPFNITESIPSDEVCITLQQDLPLITNVTVENTNTSNGEIRIKWIKPKLPDLDTTTIEGPYKYEIAKSNDGNNYSVIQSSVLESQNFNDPIPLEFADRGINTVDNQYYYRVDFYNDGTLYSSSPIASSVFLDIKASDQINDLSWDETTPWTNYNYNVYRQNIGDPFQNINSVNDRSYTDTNVENEVNYCYYIESEGSYGLPNIETPLFNLSQVVCAQPLDTVGPCPPILTVENPCDQIDSGDIVEDLFNRLSWTLDNEGDCADNDDTNAFNIYFSNTREEDLVLIESFDLPIRNFDHQLEEGISGCYAISAIDNLGNEGALSETICVENCPIYRLPNTFTPNQDGSNDLFVPLENQFVINIDFKVFNRWGNLLYESADPNINWDGNTLEGDALNEGTYYYTCKVFGQNLEGNIEEVDLLSGYIQIIR